MTSYGRSARFLRKWRYCWQRISVRLTVTGSICKRTLIWRWRENEWASRLHKSFPILMTQAAPCKRSNGMAVDLSVDRRQHLLKVDCYVTRDQAAIERVF